MNGKLILAALISGAAGAIYYLSTQTGAEDIQVTQTPPPDQPQSNAPEPVVRNGQVLSTGKDTFKPRAVAARDVQPEHNSAGTAQRDSIIWQESEKAKEVLQTRGGIPADVRQEAYIQIDRQELMTVEIGEYLDLYIPQLGGSYTGEVDFIQQHSNGDRTVEAHIPGAGTLYSAVITLGEEAIYGNLATQEDVFILEGNGEYAWLAPKSAMISNHHENPMPATAPVTDQKQNNDDEIFAINPDLSPQQ